MPLALPYLCKENPRRARWSVEDSSVSTFCFFAVCASLVWKIRLGALGLRSWELFSGCDGDSFLPVRSRVSSLVLADFLFTTINLKL